jgi:hypothetical protein
MYANLVVLLHIDSRVKTVPYVCKLYIYSRELKDKNPMVG